MRQSRFHKTVRVVSGQWHADIDVEIAPLIKALWRAGIETTGSCQDSPRGWVWLAFPHPSFEAFVKRVVESANAVEVQQGVPSVGSRDDLFVVRPTDALRQRATATTGSDKDWRYIVVPQQTVPRRVGNHEVELTIHYAVVFPAIDLAPVTQLFSEPKGKARS